MRNLRATFLGSVALTGALVFAGGVALAAEGPAWDHDVAFGVAFTSDYIARGATQTEGGPAVQPWAELDISKFYVGYWGSNVSAAGVAYWENDLSIGVRPTLGPVSIDLGYVRYIYSSNTFATPSGEAYVKASFSPVDPLTLGASFYVNPEMTANTYAELNAAYAFKEHFTVSGAVGFANSGGVASTPWNIGLAWKPVDPVTLDVRYQSGPTANKVVFTLSVASSVSALKAMVQK